MVRVGCEIFLLCFVATPLPVSFISRALEHVDNLGAYTASRPETGLLIPSGYISYPCLHQLSVCHSPETLHNETVQRSYDLNED